MFSFIILMGISFFSEMKSYELRVVSCYFKKINSQVASYFLQVVVLKE